MQTLVTDLRGVCLSVSLSVARLSLTYNCGETAKRIEILFSSEYSWRLKEHIVRRKS